MGGICDRERRQQRVACINDQTARQCIKLTQAVQHEWSTFLHGNKRKDYSWSGYTNPTPQLRARRVFPTPLEALVCHDGSFSLHRSRGVAVGVLPSFDRSTNDYKKQEPKQLAMFSERGRVQHEVVAMKQRVRTVLASTMEAGIYKLEAPGCTCACLQWSADVGNSGHEALSGYWYSEASTIPGSARYGRYSSGRSGPLYIGYARRYFCAGTGCACRGSGGFAEAQ